MDGFSRRLEESVLDFLWSLWAELGASGWTRRHGEWGIDPEPLVLFTAAVGQLDPRLRDESTDWCIRYSRYVSVARLKNLLRSAQPPVCAAFGEYAATVNVHAGARWPGATQTRTYQPTGRSHVEAFTRPAHITLRLRALFGVGARAEILRSFVLSPAASLVASDFPEAHYTKRIIAAELESLRMGGLLHAAPRRNQRVFRLTRGPELLGLIGEVPSCFPRWSLLLDVLYEVLALARRADDLEPVLRAVEASRLIRARAPDLVVLSLRAPSQEVVGEAFWDEFAEWALSVVSSLAAGDGQVISPEHHSGGAPLKAPVVEPGVRQALWASR